jgi:hypothetical protein
MTHGLHPSRLAPLAPQDEVCFFISKDYPHAEEDAQHPSRSTRIIGAFCELVYSASKSRRIGLAIFTTKTRRHQESAKVNSHPWCLGALAVQNSADSDQACRIKNVSK